MKSNHFLFFLLFHKTIIDCASNRVKHSMLKEYQINFHDLVFDRTEIESLLGFENQEVPEPFPFIINQALKEATALFEIRGGFQIFNNIDINPFEGFVKIENQVFKPGKIVTTQFKNAHSIALFICTAGSAISEKAKAELDNGDPLMGFVLDTIGSVVAEKATEKLHQMLALDIKQLALTVSDRFSPGYCDWSVGEQQNIFALLPEDFCGVTLSESSLMWPIKSVSGMIAIGKNMHQKSYQCHWCKDELCIYGKLKRKKMNEKKSQKTVG